MEELQNILSYEDGRVAHQLRTWRDVASEDNKAQKRDNYKPHWFIAQYGRDALDAKVEALDQERKKSVLKPDGTTYSGLVEVLADRFGATIWSNVIDDPLQPDRWASARLPYPLRDYQVAAVDGLMAGAIYGAPAAVELPTGSGKTAVAAELIRRHGLDAIVLVPTLSIAGQFTKYLKSIFGDSSVGRFYDRFKEHNRPIVVAVSASAMKADPGVLDRFKVLIGDESHLLPAETLEALVVGMLGHVPCRFFLSGTQIRSDGLDLVLAGILGPVVLRKTVRELVDAGYLAKPNFHQFVVRSEDRLNNRNGVEMNRAHLHRNPEVHQHAAELVMEAFENGCKPLVLIEEVPQFMRLYKHIQGFGIRVGFAHGGMTPEKRDGIPQEFWKSEPNAKVDAFEAGEIDILIGTSCIATGTDFKKVDFIVDLVGLTSEVRLHQSPGRGTRLAPGKTEFAYVDYDIANVPLLQRHAEKRRAIFDDICGPTTIHEAGAR